MVAGHSRHKVFFFVEDVVTPLVGLLRQMDFLGQAGKRGTGCAGDTQGLAPSKMGAFLLVCDSFFLDRSG